MLAALYFHSFFFCDAAVHSLAAVAGPGAVYTRWADACPRRRLTPAPPPQNPGPALTATSLTCCSAVAYTYMPDARVPLTARGWQQAICAGDSLRREMDALEGGRPYKLFFYTSPYLRSRQVGFCFIFFSSGWVAWCGATPVDAVAGVASDRLPPRFLSSRRHTRAWCRRLTPSSSRGCRRRCSYVSRSVVSCTVGGAS